AEYTFYNPTEDTVNTKMAFPIGLIPYYVEGVEKSDKISKIENPITVNGQPVEYSVRHTYGTYNSFEEDVKKLKDTYYETDFFKTDLPVTEYVFKVNLTTDNEYATFRVKMPENEGTRFFGYTDYNGNFEIYLNNGAKFSIFVLGNDFDISNLDWTATRFSRLFNRYMQVNGSVTLEKKLEPTTFKDFVLKSYDSKSDISEVDFYNAMFDLIKKDGVWAGYGTTPDANNFTEWYVYETSVAPGGTFKNAVTATLYPTVYYNYSPNIYEYNYYLSPAKEWAAFGNLTVNINTAQYMQKCDYYDPADTENSAFKKTETGYTATFTSLPTTELSFKTCSVETPGLPDYGSGTSTALWIVVGVFGFFFLVGPIVLALILLTIFLIKRAIKKKKAAQNSAQPTGKSPDPAPTPELPPVDGDIDGGIAEPETVETQNQSAEGEGTALVEKSAEIEKEKKVFCVYCGSKLNNNAKFCPNCGGVVPPDMPVQPVQPVQPTGYVPARNEGKRVNGFGIAGFVLSLIALCSFSSPIVILFLGAAFGLSLTGVILRKKYQGVYGLAIAGLVISSVIIFNVILIAGFAVIGVVLW
ncbi:MAG: hypothetical protein ACI4QN_01290, partial [Candidatus Coproplasma sp.]